MSKKSLSVFWNTAVVKVGGLKNTKENFLNIAQEFINIAKPFFTKEEIMKEVNVQAHQQCHLDGEYFDWYPRYRLDFKHHQGGGNYFATGYREEMEKIKNTIRSYDPNYYCWPEGKSEIEVGVFDAMLMEWFYSGSNGIVGPYAGIGTPIPLISYLYH